MRALDVFVLSMVLESAERNMVDAGKAALV